MKPEYLSISASLQSALVRMITPNIREIRVNFTDTDIDIYYYFDQPPSEIEEELSEEVSTEVMCDFVDVSTHVHRLVIPEPQFIPKGDTLCVYARWEEPLELND